MFQNAHEKGEQHRDPKDPPRGRGINAGHGTYENDRLSVGVLIRSSSQDISLSVNLLLISNLSLLSSYQNSFDALNLNMSQEDTL